MKAQNKIFVTTISVLSIIALSNISHANNDNEIRKRVQKVGQLKIQGDSNAQAQPESETIPEPETSATSTNDTQQATVAKPATSETPIDSAAASASYQASCFACHGTGAAGAPILGDTAGWAPRITKGEQSLIDNAINGIGAMPPRGGSMLDDETISSVVKHMIQKSQ